MTTSHMSVLGAAFWAVAGCASLWGNGALLTEPQRTCLAEAAKAEAAELAAVKTEADVDRIMDHYDLVTEGCLQK